MLIVGLGNPGAKYERTRHNAGWRLIEKFADHAGLKMALESRHKAYVARGNYKGKMITLAIPLTYMNLSGQSVISLANYFKYEPAEILVAYDDKDFDTGIIKLRHNGSAGGHNGIKSLIAHLNTENFPRLRIGVGPKPPDMVMSDFVLSNFHKHENDEILPGVFDKGIQAIDAIITEGMEKAMMTFNRK